MVKPEVDGQTRVLLPCLSVPSAVPGGMQRAPPALLAVLMFLSATHAFSPAPAALRPPSAAGSAQRGRVLGLSSPGACRAASGVTVRRFMPRVGRGGVVMLRAQSAEEVAGEVERPPSSTETPSS